MPTFKQLISRSKEVVQAALIPVKAMQAKNDLQKGIYDVKSQLLDATASRVNEEGLLSTAQESLETLKGSIPFNVQGILTAKRNIDLQNNRIAEAKKTEEYLQGTLDFLNNLMEELFPASEA